MYKLYMNVNFLPIKHFLYLIVFEIAMMRIELRIIFWIEAYSIIFHIQAIFPYLEENNVRILVNSYYLFDDYTSSGLHISIQKVSFILDWLFTHSRKNVSISVVHWIHCQLNDFDTGFRQLDIGLEQFATKQLFVRLFTPTFFVIITVIQVHYFHNDFMALSDPNNTVPTIKPSEDLEQSSMQGGAEVGQTSKDENTDSVQFDIYQLGCKYKKCFLVP